MAQKSLSPLRLNKKTPLIPPFHSECNTHTLSCNPLVLLTGLWHVSLNPFSQTSNRNSIFYFFLTVRSRIGFQVDRPRAVCILLMLVFSKLKGDSHTPHHLPSSSLFGCSAPFDEVLLNLLIWKILCDHKRVKVSIFMDRIDLHRTQSGPPSASATTPSVIYKSWDWAYGKLTFLSIKLVQI